MRVIGIDPGLQNTGWGIVEADGNRLRHIANGAVHSTSTLDPARRLKELHDGLMQVIEAYQPETAAVEETFVNKNPRFHAQAWAGARHRAGGSRACWSGSVRIPRQSGQEIGGWGRSCDQGADPDDGGPPAAGGQVCDARCRRRAGNCYLPHPSRRNASPGRRQDGGGSAVIAKLTGRLDSTGPDWAIIDVNGVGYLISCSRRTLSALGAIGSPARVWTEVRARDELPHLFGFADLGERDWFRLLTTVQGVGAKVALAILSILTPDKLLLAIAAQDRAALGQADGVGPKLATRLLSELKDKAPMLGAGLGVELPDSLAASNGGEAGLTGDAVSALVNLGYGRSDALSVVARLRRDGDELSDLIRRSLKELSK